MKPLEQNILAISPLELQLKYCFEQRPEIAEHILTGEELAAYIGWMAASYGKQSAYRGALGKNREEAPKIRSLGEQILSHPEDKAVLENLSQVFRHSQEDVFFSSEQDVAVSNVLRYMPAHWHRNNYFEVLYCFSGDCPLHFPNEVIHMKPGTLVIVAPGIVHASPCYSDNAVAYYFSIRASTFEEVFWKLIPPENLLSGFFRQALSGKQPNSYLQFETENDGEIRELLLKILAESSQGEPYHAQLMNAYMSTCLILLLRRYEGSTRLPRSEDFYWKHEYSAILSYIQTHLASVKLPELAERYHYSEKQIRRIVQSCTGENYTALLTRLRMEKAVGLMRQTSLSMNEIAGSVGYSTVNSFYRAFSHYYGCPPARYLSAKE